MEGRQREGLVSKAKDSFHEESDDLTPPDFPFDRNLRFIPSFLRFDNGPIDANGLALDMFGRSTIWMSSLFLGPALILLASEAADEKCGGDSNCRIYGFRPSSILANIAVVAGLSSSLLMPLFGAIVDHTCYRRQVGSYTAFGLVIVKLIEIGVGRATWFYVALLQVASSMLYFVHLTASYAYNSELSSDPNVQSYYNTHLSIIMYCSTLLYLVEVLALSAVFGTGDVGTGRLALAITATTCAIFFYPSWMHLFGDRPALSKVPEGMTLLTSGFRKVFHTLHRINSEFSALKWLMLSITFAEAAMASLTAISTTYMTQVLGMNSNEFGIMFLIVLVAGIPGSKLGGWLAIRLRNPVTSAKICDVFMIVITTAACLLLTGPGHKTIAYIIGGFWGVGLAWLSPMHTTAFISMIPKNQDAELMGMFLLCTQVLSWLPPLVFTALNEAGFDMAYGMASLNLFFFVALAFLLIMGDYDEALMRVQSSEVNQEVEMEGRELI